MPPTHRPTGGTYVTVEDVDATARKAEAMGAKTPGPTHGHPQGRTLLHAPRPQGAVIAAITYVM